jgi:hypothetical protein
MGRAKIAEVVRSEKQENGFLHKAKDGTAAAAAGLGAVAGAASAPDYPASLGEDTDDESDASFDRRLRREAAQHNDDDDDDFHLDDDDDNDVGLSEDEATEPDLASEEDDVAASGPKARIRVRRGPSKGGSALLQRRRRRRRQQGSADDQGRQTVVLKAYVDEPTKKTRGVSCILARMGGSLDASVAEATQRHETW